MDINEIGRKQGWPYNPAYNATQLDLWFEDVISQINTIWRDFSLFELDGLLDLDTTVEAYAKNEYRMRELENEISERADALGDLARDLQRAIKIAKEELEAMPRYDALDPKEQARLKKLREVA